MAGSRGEFGGRTDGVFSVAFSANDQTIVSAHGDQTVRLWDVATGKGSAARRSDIRRRSGPSLSRLTAAHHCLCQHGRHDQALGPRTSRLPFRAAGPDTRLPRFHAQGANAADFRAPAPLVFLCPLGCPFRRASLLEADARMNLSRAYASSSFSPETGASLAFANGEAVITVCDLATGHLQKLDDPSTGSGCVPRVLVR